MTRWYFPLAGLLVAACGGSTTPSPPPPPPAVTPSSVAISAGDGQEAAPGAAVPTPPAVVVRSASGAAVPNVAVTFAIDSGGGSITTPTATTNASGIATPGAWTLGPAEGPQVLLATVTGLTPVKLRASARTPTADIASVPIARGGGTSQVDRPGTPLDGAALTLTNGSVSTSTPISLAITSTAGVSLNRGMTPIGPGLLVTSTAGPLDRPATVRFPTSTPPNANTFLVAHNPRTGQSTVLPQQRADATGISALLSALDASIVPLPDGAAPAPTGFFAAAAAADDPLLLILTAVPPEALTRDYDSGFVVGRDNWEFTNLAVAWLPFLPGASDGSPAERVIDPGSGMVATALWYFKTMRGTPPLFNRFPLQRDQPKSNKVGIRWSALASSLVRPATAAVLEELKDLVDDDPALFHWSSLTMTKQMFYVGDDRPVPLLLYPAATLDDFEEESDPDIRIAIATKIVGDEITIYVPENANAPYTLRVTRAGGLEPRTILSLEGESYTIRSFVPVHARPLLDIPAVASNWPRVLDGTVGDAEGWPVPELHWEKGKLDENNVFLAENLTQFWECPACPDFGVKIPGAPDAAVNPQGFQVGKIVGGTMARLPERVVRSSIDWGADSVDSDVGPTRAGNHIVLTQDEDPAGFVAGWLDWRTVTYRKASLHPTPATVTFSKDTTINLTVSPSQPLPAGTTWSWILRTDSGRDSVASLTSSHSRELTKGQKGKLLIIAHEKDSKRPIARDSIPIQPAEALPFWRITTIADEDELFEGDETGDEFWFLLGRVLAVPQSGLIALEEEPGGRTVLRIRVLPATTWGSSNCCPPSLTPLPGEKQFLLGESPFVNYSVGPFFAGFGVSRWAQSTEDLDAGTLTGQFVHGGLITRLIEDGGDQAGPRDLVRISATRAGTMMTGTIEVYGWGEDEETGEVGLDGNPAIWRLSF